jgi:hypothetical protein
MWLSLSICQFVAIAFDQLLGQLGCWLFACLVGWWVRSFVGWLCPLVGQSQVGWVVRWVKLLVRQSVVWWVGVLVDWLFCWFVERWVIRIVGWSVVRMVGGNLVGPLTGRSAVSFNLLVSRYGLRSVVGRLMGWLVVSFVDWLE